MSLNRKRELRQVAKAVCRDLRKRSTDAERVLWEALRQKRLNGFKFHRQYAILHDLTGRESFYVADFYCHKARLIVEIDGPIHEDHQKSDEFRTEVLNALGIRVLRFKNEEVLTDTAKVLSQVAMHLTAPFPLPRERGPGG